MLKKLQALSSEQNILYVEDEEILRDGMQNMLHKLFQNVHIATNGKEALEVYKKENIDIVLTDINMPIMDGIELINEINKLTINPVIIVLSAHDESHLLYKLINLEVNSFLNKLSSKDELIKILYKNCSIIADKKLLKMYAQKLKEENLAVARKNKILEHKFHQLAHLENHCKDINHNLTKYEKEKFIQEDKDELDDLSCELEGLVLSLHNEKIPDIDSIFKLSNLLMHYSLLLSYYESFFDISVAFDELSKDIINYEEHILNDIKNYALHFETLLTSMDIFRQNVWIKESVNPKFYNKSLINEINIVSDYLKNEI